MIKIAESFRSRLFDGLENQELNGILPCLEGVIRKYKKGDFVFHSGDEVRKAGVILSGQVMMIKEDFWGRRSIVGSAGKGEIFGESYACLGKEASATAVQCSEDSEILFLDGKKLMLGCGKGCTAHEKLTSNLVAVLAEKNAGLTKKIGFMSASTTREKLLSYLSYCSGGKTEFTIPYNRQELADYLSVDRSAMSKELSKLRDDGYLEYRKNHFKIIEK